jgi:hypothetical protein
MKFRLWRSKLRQNIPRSILVSLQTNKIEKISTAPISIDHSTNTQMIEGAGRPIFRGSSSTPSGGIAPSSASTSATVTASMIVKLATMPIAKYVAFVIALL